MEILHSKGAAVSYSDPHVPAFPKMRKHHFDLRSIELSPGLLSTMDCVLIATAHGAFDYELIQQNCKLIVDTRADIDITSTMWSKRKA